MTQSSPPKPVVGVLANQVHDGLLPGQSVDEKYLSALTEVSDVDVIIIPALANQHGYANILGRIDGLLLTGAATNVHPRYFQPDAEEAAYQPFDIGRDDAALALIRLAVERDLPLLAICRGAQELNVAFGGTLHANIALDEAYGSHTTWVKDAPLDVLYGPSHDLVVRPGGWIDRLLGKGPAQVNSLHVQAIAQVGEGLEVEAHAPDGTVEAVSIKGATFGLGLQWHPEYKAAENDISRPIFQAFGAAVRDFWSNRRPA